MAEPVSDGYSRRFVARGSSRNSLQKSAFGFQNNGISQDFRKGGFQRTGFTYRFEAEHRRIAAAAPDDGKGLELQLAYLS